MESREGRMMLGGMVRVRRKGNERVVGDGDRKSHGSEEQAGVQEKRAVAWTGEKAVALQFSRMTSLGQTFPCY